MSSPTPGSDPNAPQAGTPQGQPTWGAPQGSPAPGYDPAPSYSGAPAGYGGQTGQRPGMVTAAAIVAIVWGGLGTLFGLLIMSVAFSVFAVLGLLVLLAVVLSVGLLVGGIFVLQGKSPKLLLYLCYAAIVINLIELIIALTQSGGSAFSGILGFIVPGVIVALLLQQQSKQYYASKGMSY
jgi:hypothetical protein